MSDIIQGNHLVMVLVTALTLHAMPFDTERINMFCWNTLRLLCRDKKQLKLINNCSIYIKGRTHAQLSTLYICLHILFKTTILKIILGH